MCERASVCVRGGGDFITGCLREGKTASQVGQTRPRCTL